MCECVYECVYVCERELMWKYVHARGGVCENKGEVIYPCL